MPTILSRLFFTSDAERPRQAGLAMRHHEDAAAARHSVIDETYRLMMDTVLRAPVILAAILTILAAGGCRDQPAAPKSARETDNLYARKAATRAAYSE